MTNYCFYALDGTERLSVLHHYKQFQRGPTRNRAVAKLVLSETPFLVLLSSASIAEHISPFMSLRRRYVSKIDVTLPKFMARVMRKLESSKISGFRLISHIPRRHNSYVYTLFRRVCARAQKNYAPLTFRDQDDGYDRLYNSAIQILQSRLLISRGKRIRAAKCKC